MQPDSDEMKQKRNFRGEEYIGSAPEGLRGKSNTYELVYKEKDEFKPES